MTNRREMQKRTQKRTLNDTREIYDCALEKRTLNERICEGPIEWKPRYSPHCINPSSPVMAISFGPFSRRRTPDHTSLLLAV